MSDLEDLDLLDEEEEEDLEFSDLDLDELEKSSSKPIPPALAVEKTQQIATVTETVSDEELNFTDSEEHEIREEPKDDTSPRPIIEEKPANVNQMKLDIPKNTITKEILSELSHTEQTPRSTKSLRSQSSQSLKSDEIRSLKSENMKSAEPPLSPPKLESSACQTDWSIPSYISFDIQSFFAYLRSTETPPENSQTSKQHEEEDEELEYLSEGEIPSLIATALDSVATTRSSVPIGSLPPLTLSSSYSTIQIPLPTNPIPRKQAPPQIRSPKDDLYREYAEKLQGKYGDRVSKALDSKNNHFFSKSTDLSVKPSARTSSANMDKELQMLREKAKNMLTRESSPMNLKDNSKRFRYERS